jgi:hypothetical protein
MAQFLAHYHSPASADVRGMGYFEFESASRAGSRDNLRDARVRMLELFGKDAASWEVDEVKRATAKSAALAGQMQLDFRPEKRKRKPKKDYR